MPLSSLTTLVFAVALQVSPMDHTGSALAGTRNLAVHVYDAPVETPSQNGGRVSILGTDTKGIHWKSYQRCNRLLGDHKNPRRQ